MNIQAAYDTWSQQYDTNANRTRDLEAIAVRTALRSIPVQSCLEIGCGTGKNTEWLITRASSVTAVDLSEKMLEKARAKVNSSHVEFVQADVTKPWTFAHPPYDLVTFSLVLEHLPTLGDVFKKASDSLKPGGIVYVGELHPFKQYQGSKARFDTPEGVQVVDCFTHHISDFITAAADNNLTLTGLSEYFDDEDRSSIPRLLSMVFAKNS